MEKILKLLESGGQVINGATRNRQDNWAPKAAASYNTMLPMTSPTTVDNLTKGKSLSVNIFFV